MMSYHPAQFSAHFTNSNFFQSFGIYEISNLIKRRLFCPELQSTLMGNTCWQDHGEQVKLSQQGDRQQTGVNAGTQLDFFWFPICCLEPQSPFKMRLSLKLHPKVCILGYSKSSKVNNGDQLPLWIFNTNFADQNGELKTVEMKFIQNL